MKHSTCPCYRCASDRGEDYPVGEIPDVTIPIAVAQIDSTAAELSLLTQSLSAAVGYYSCPCGSAFDFTAGMGIEDYAALNRWLGRHNDDCKDRLLLELAEADAGLAQLRAKIDAACRQRDDANMKVSAMRMAP